MPSVEQNGTTAQDYFAELYVAGLMANAGWNVCFPHRDRGMDFIISKTGADGSEIIRPVQVKGKYPSTQKGNKHNTPRTSPDTMKLMLRNVTNYRGFALTISKFIVSGTSFEEISLAYWLILQGQWKQLMPVHQVIGLLP